MDVWEASLANELKDGLERVSNISLLLVVQIQVQIVQVRMRIGEVIVTSVRDVQDVCDAESLYDVSIACVMPIAEVETSWEYLVWVIVSLHRSRNHELTTSIQTVMSVVLLNLVKATNA